MTEEMPVYTVGGKKENWELIPNYMWEGIRNWIEYGVEPGDFLCSVLKNDLKEACGRADGTNQRMLFNYVMFLYNHAPIGSWGSEENFTNWRNQKGLGYARTERSDQGHTDTTTDEETPD